MSRGNPQGPRRGERSESMTTAEYQMKTYRFGCPRWADL